MRELLAAIPHGPELLLMWAAGFWWFAVAWDRMRQGVFPVGFRQWAMFSLMMPCQDDEPGSLAVMFKEEG